GGRGVAGQETDQVLGAQGQPKPAAGGIRRGARDEGALVRDLPERYVVGVGGHDEERGAEGGQRLEAERGGRAEKEHAREAVDAGAAADPDLSEGAEVVEVAPARLERGARGQDIGGERLAWRNRDATA